MLNGVLEVCVDSYESAEAAVRGGATRLELCSNLVIGGTTPGMHLFQKIKTNLSIPVNVLIRPRFGDFLYTDSEFQIISEDVKAFHQMGADGVVVGCLDPEGDLDMERMMILREMAAMGLTGCENQPVRELSGGMRRRVAILRALLCGADVIFLDEPFKGLDEATKALVVAETKRLCAGKTVLLVTHEEKEAAMMGAKQVVRMEMDVKNTSV